MHMRKTKAPLITNADVHVQVFTTGILHLKWNTVFVLKILHEGFLHP